LQPCDAPDCERKPTPQPRGGSKALPAGLVAAISLPLDFDLPHAIVNHLVIRVGALPCDRLNGLTVIVRVDDQQEALGCSGFG